MVQKRLLLMILIASLLIGCRPSQPGFLTSIPQSVTEQVTNTPDQLSSPDPATTYPAGDTSGLASYLDDLDAGEKFSGVVLFAKDGYPIYELASGMANDDENQHNQIDTKFNLGSMNKMFTAVAILQLVEQGTITVDDKIIEHLPSYPNQEVATKVTIHQLLTHTSGIEDYFTREYSETDKHLLRDLSDYLPFFVGKPLQFAPGTRSFYSNSGYIVLGLIIEEVSGQDYFDYVKQNIYQPCGMMETDSYEIGQGVPNLAFGYRGIITNTEGRTTNLDWLPVKGNSAGGGYSTASDLTKFSQCLLTNQLLRPEWTDLLLDGKVDSPISGKDGQYAYGFFVSMINEHKVVGHGGLAPGVCTNLDIFLETGYSVVVLSNVSSGCIRVVSEIYDTLLD